MLASIVRRGTRIVAAVALATAALAACSGSPTESGRFVRIVTDRDEYVSGTSGTATVTNVSGRPVHYSFCESEVQRLTSTGWEVVGRSPEDQGFVCASILLTLHPGESARVGFVLKAGLPEGSYRLRYPGIFPRENGRRASAQVSEPFRVEPAPVPE